MRHDILLKLVTGPLGADAESAIDDIVIADAPAGPDGMVGRAEFAMALGVILHRQLIHRVPTGAAYVEDVRNDGRQIMLDHGALRTIQLPDGGATGAIPSGVAAFARILEPLGYVRADRYPLDQLKMTGYAWCQADLPADLPQYFVSELHVDRFSPEFQAAAQRVFGDTHDALRDDALAALAGFAADGAVPLDVAALGIVDIVLAFGRHHGVPALADYEILKAESAEAAWIATEGNAFNHATDRVADVEIVADAQRAASRAMKDRVEISSSGRVRQTAFRADRAERQFRDANGELVRLTVPGSFYEFIARDVDAETGALDLKFDSANAQGIFKMTALDA